MNKELIEKKYRVYKMIHNKIKKANNIAIISHINPDIDTISSSLALKKTIWLNFRTKKIDLVCADKIPNNFHFLFDRDYFYTDLNPYYYDLIIFLDVARPSQTWFELKYKKLFSKEWFNTLTIDHHISNTLFSRQNILIWDYSSTTMILYEIFKFNKYKIDKNIANLLLSWIYADTWILKHSNTTKHTFKYLSEIFKYNPDLQFILDNLIRNNKLSTLKLYWKIFKDSFITNDDVLNSYISQTSLDNYNSDYNDIKGVLDYLSWIKWVKYAQLLTQKWEYVRCSLRTLRDDIDLIKIASKFKWWWHKKASGFTTKAKINFNTWVEIVE